MTETYDRDAPIINRGTRDHHCFGCGKLNDIGLQLEFRANGAGVWADFTPDRRFEGYVGMVHGGVLSTMMDEAMSWAITVNGQFAVTTRLNMVYRNPATIGAALRVEGRVVARRRRMIETAATIVDVESGALVAEAEGRFLRVPPEQAQSWEDTYLGNRRT